MALKDIQIIVGIIIGILSIVGIISGFFKKTWLWIRARFSSDLKLKVPPKTIIVLPTAGQRTTWWHMGSSGGKQAMQISGKFVVTNISKIDILLPVAKIKHPLTLGQVTVKDSHSDYYGNYMIPSGGTTEMSVHFWLLPPVKKENETLTANIAILDQFGNEHWLKNVRFTYL